MPTCLDSGFTRREVWLRWMGVLRRCFRKLVRRGLGSCCCVCLTGEKGFTTGDIGVYRGYTGANLTLVLLGREKLDLDCAGWDAFKIVVCGHQRRVFVQRQRSCEGIDKRDLKVVLEDGCAFGEILVRRDDR